MKRNRFDDIIPENINPELEWNDYEFRCEKELQTFLVENIEWLKKVVKKMFMFTTLEFLGKEYSVIYRSSEKYSDSYDLAFRHGEDIVICELKYGYGAESSKAYYQLKEYKERFNKIYENKVYRFLITTHVNKNMAKAFLEDDENWGILELKRKMHNIEFEKTKAYLNQTLLEKYKEKYKYIDFYGGNNEYRK